MKFSYSLIKKLLPKCPPKQKLVDGLNLHSFEAENSTGDVFEVSLPANRYSDAASHVGIAREVAAVFRLKAKLNTKTFVNLPSEKGFVDISIKNPKLCPRYAARYFELQSPVRESPKWMKEILASCGIKPINNVVDIMNYVMLETGQPMHAFDADKLVSSVKRRGSRVKIIVRPAKKGEKIKTLDGQKLVLDAGILVIADKKGPVAIAGIKGGADSGVTEKTKRIIVEAANFDPAAIYRGAKILKLQTDAALRFGHGLSPAIAPIGLDRATELLLKEKAWLLDSVDASSARMTEEVIEFSPQRYEAIVGAPIERKKAEAIFASLGFWIEPLKKKAKDPAAFLVKIPAWRTDIENFEDLAEEVVRLEGYAKLRPKAPVLSIRPAHQEDVVNLKDRVRRILLGFQLDEVYNSTFVGKPDSTNDHERMTNNKGYESSVTGHRLVEVENPISEDRRYLRPSLTPMLLKNAENNSRFYGNIRIFELGKVFSGNQKGVGERLSLGTVLAEKNEPKLVLEMKGLVDDLMRGLGVDDFSIVAAGESLRVEVGRSVLGIIGRATLEKGLHAAFAEFDLDKIMQFTEEAKEFIPLKRFPSVLRDISVLASKEVHIGDVVQTIQNVNSILIENVDLVDEYEDEKLGGKQSLTFRIIFQAEDRTLTDTEVNAEMEKIAVALKKEFRAEIR